MTRLLASTFLSIGILVSACSPRTAGQAPLSVADAIAVVDEDPCLPMTQEQGRRAALALEVLQTYRPYDQIYDGAMEVFGQAQGLKDPQPFCLDAGLAARVAAATLASGAWERGLAGEVRLRLARRLGPRDRRIVDDVASTAFHPRPVDDVGFADVRPLARSVLASFGVAAAPWRGQALAQMNARNSLGTSAAQVAAASKEPAAVEAVAGLLRAELRRQPPGALRREPAKRLIELAYAIGAAGDAGRPHAAILLDLLDRDVQSAAPPFGLITRPPSEVCRALQRIGGPEAARGLDSPRCAERPWSLLPG